MGADRAVQTGCRPSVLALGEIPQRPAGGISVGIVWHGETAPTQTDTAIHIGIAGSGGVGGVPGTNDGLVGVERKLLRAL